MRAGSVHGCSQWHCANRWARIFLRFAVGVVGFKAAGALGIGLLVWVGVYFGARFAPSHQRNGRLVRLAAITFGVLGLLLSLPIKTHAVRLDMPSAGDASASQFLPLLIPVALIAAVVLGSGLITRALAAVSGSRVA